MEKKYGVKRHPSKLFLSHGAWIAEPETLTTRLFDSESEADAHVQGLLAHPDHKNSVFEIVAVFVAEKRTQ